MIQLGGIDLFLRPDDCRFLSLSRLLLISVSSQRSWKTTGLGLETMVSTTALEI